MELKQLLTEKRKGIIQIAEKHGAYNIRIFGSVARGENNSDSDIDFLVDIESGRSLLDRIALIQELEDFLECRVDVVKSPNLSMLIRDKVFNEAIWL
ncbi:nucleotidyltransferase family protein [Gloeocapsa sp. PCC 73106]|uniref:nucleotidyltransferase family protein n=1 Tax=Gloeocapsa sp. PCC 73106 TaxID=102232 RepID=UPI0002AC49D4|nr:nucleotidyltransferase family protein [Gloeocapsa sp. PCC 73106]ELR98486.1 putative nucleotidyltransferase [Gloeocapsa sp. PCC 73106]